MILSGPDGLYDPQPYQKWATFFPAMSVGDSYNLIVYDSQGDGMQSPNFQGFVEIRADNITIARGGRGIFSVDSIPFSVPLTVEPADEALAEPTMAPTSAPTLTKSRQFVSVKFQYDGYPNETSWTIQEATHGQIVYRGPNYQPEPFGEWLTDFGQIPPGAYILTVFDTYGDGLVTGDFVGSFEVQLGDETSLSLNGTLVQGIGNFESAASISFVVDP